MTGRVEEFKEDFEQDVPGHMHEDILTRIVEAAWEFSEDPDITIDDCEKRDALNIDFTGTIMIDGREHSFHIRDGNIAGTEILSWNKGVELEREPQTVLALAPIRSDVDNAIVQGRALDFIENWNRDLDPSTERGAVISKLVSAYAYDRFFAPGTGAAQTHARKAREFGYEITESDVAEATRKRLIRSSLRIRPPEDWPRKTPDEARSTYEVWTDYRKGGDITDIINAVAERLSKTLSVTPNSDEVAALKSHGFRFASYHEETLAWQRGMSGLYVIKDIEDFDRSKLPEDPFKSLVNTLDPSIISDTAVDPVRACAELLDAVTSRMARERIWDVSDEDRKRFEAYGYTFENKAPDCWIVDESGMDVAVYRAQPMDKGSDGRTYRIEGDSVTGLEFDSFEDGYLVFGEFDRHEARYSERLDSLASPDC